MLRKILSLMLAFSISACLLAGCNDSSNDRPRKKAVKRETAETSSFQLAQPQEGDPIAIFDTSEGEIRAVLYPQYAPMAVENFTSLCEQGYYNGTVFHRSVYGFVVQGGDASGTGKKGATIWNNNPFPPEYSPHLHHFSGALCAARSSEEEISTNSQFYFVQSLPGPLEEGLKTQLEAAGTDASVVADYDAVGGLPYLDYTDTVFGQVYQGLSVVDEIGRADTDEADRPLEDITVNSITISTYTAADTNSGSKSNSDAVSSTAADSSSTDSTTSQDSSATAPEDTDSSAPTSDSTSVPSSAA